MYKHEFQKRIRYGETDKMGYLYYGNYPLLYEIGRVEAIRALNISYKVLEDEYKVMMPVVHVQSRYKLPVYYDEQITIRTILKDLPNKMIHFYHEILNEKGAVVHLGEVKLFFVNMESGRRVDTPSYLLNALQDYFDE